MTVVEAAPDLLAPEEPESGALLAGGVRTADGHRRPRPGPGPGRPARRQPGSPSSWPRASRWTASALLVATGRQTDLAALGVGVARARRTARGRSRWTRPAAWSPGVWAIGDITGEGAFTHVSMYQAGIAVADILGQDRPPRPTTAPCPG